MNILGRSADSGLPGYDTGRMFGLTSEADFDFNALAQGLDCSRNFNRVGIIYDDGKKRWLVRPSAESPIRLIVPYLMS